MNYQQLDTVYFLSGIQSDRKKQKRDYERVEKKKGTET